jgi:hypothetical protein
MGIPEREKLVSHEALEKIGVYDDFATGDKVAVSEEVAAQAAKEAAEEAAALNPGVCDRCKLESAERTEAIIHVTDRRTERPMLCRPCYIAVVR